MTYNFDEIIDRHGTNSLKFDFNERYQKPADTLSLWVADMDFKSPPAVIDALTKAVARGIFGYSDIKEDYFEAIHSWFLKRFSWDIKSEWLLTTPGVVYALNIAVKAFTKPGDSVLIQRPVYYPFSSVITRNQRNLVNNALVYNDGVYTIDFEDMENKIVENQVKLFIFCSPHNPAGRVWTFEELNRIGEICLKHNVLIVSDEIHADFTYPGHTHHFLASLNEDFSNNIITCTAPSKTFNIAGLQVSNIFIKNEKLRDTFEKELDLSGYDQLNLLGIVASQAAYTYGEEWLNQLLVYIKGNIDYVHSFLAKYLPKVKMVETEGTYLVWLDFGAYHLSEDELEDRIVKKAKLWLDKGTMFGPEGTGFERINVASPRSIIEQAMQQLLHAFEDL